MAQKSLFKEPQFTDLLAWVVSSGFVTGSLEDGSRGKMGCVEHELSDAMGTSCPALVPLSLPWSVLKAVIVWTPPTDIMTWVKSGISSSHTAGFPWLLLSRSHGKGVPVFPHLKAVGEPCQSLQKMNKNDCPCSPGGKPWKQNSVFSHWLLLDEANQQSGNYNLSVLKTIALKHSASTGFWCVYWQYTPKILPFHLEY